MTDLTLHSINPSNGKKYIFGQLLSSGDGSLGIFYRLVKQIMYKPEKGIALDREAFEKTIGAGDGYLRCCFEYNDSLYLISSDYFLEHGTDIDFGQGRQIQLPLSSMRRRDVVPANQLINITFSAGEA